MRRNTCITNWCTPDNLGMFVPNNNPTFCFIKHTHEHMERDNCLHADVMGCLTPFRSIIKSLNSFLVQDPIFRHILIKIIKPIRYRWPIMPSISPMISGDSKSRVSPPHFHIHRYVRAYTHTCTCFHNMFTHKRKTQSEIPSSPKGGGVGIIAMIFWHWHLGPCFS